MYSSKGLCWRFLRIETSKRTSKTYLSSRCWACRTLENRHMNHDLTEAWEELTYLNARITNQHPCLTSMKWSILFALISKPAATMRGEMRAAQMELARQYMKELNWSSKGIQYSWKTSNSDLTLKAIQVDYKMQESQRITGQQNTIDIKLIKTHKMF